MASTALPRRSSSSAADSTSAEDATAARAFAAISLLLLVVVAHLDRRAVRAHESAEPADLLRLPRERAERPRLLEGAGCFEYDVCVLAIADVGRHALERGGAVRTRSAERAQAPVCDVAGWHLVTRRIDRDDRADLPAEA